MLDGCVFISMIIGAVTTLKKVKDVITRYHYSRNDRFDRIENNDNIRRDSVTTQYHVDVINTANDIRNRRSKDFAKGCDG